MGVLRDKIEQRLAGVEDELAGVLASMDASPLDVRALAVGSRMFMERQVLVALASAVDLQEVVEHEQQQSAARSPLALRGTVYGTGTVTPREVLRDAIDGMPGERGQLLSVAGAVDGEVEEQVCSILAGAMVPSLETEDAGALAEAAHGALDAYDAALIVIADVIEQRPAE
jgi:hypothetical protein